MPPILQRFVLGWLMLTMSAVASAHGVTLQLHHPLPTDSTFHTRFILPWVDKVQKESGGRLHFHVVAGEAANAAETLFDQVKDGQADVVWTALSYTPDRFTAIEVFELPFMAGTRQAADAAMWEYLRLSDAAQNELDGVRVLSIHSGSAPVLHTREKRITRMEDLQGLKIAAATASGRRLLVAAGASSPGLPAMQIDKALADGSIDGALLAWEALPARRLDLSAKHHAEFAAKARLDSPVFLLLMNAASYRSLPDDLKKIVQDNSGPAVAAAAATALEAEAAAARRAAVDRGDTIDAIAPESSVQWQKAGRAAVEDWIEAADKKGASGKDVLDAARGALGN